MTRNKIQILPPEEARKIAAGEVIERPASLVREFMDNAIDSGASLIEVTIDGGGIKRTEVSDNGSGMFKADLEISWKTHATSKIRSLDDLETSKTLGFRGEALAAACAVARLEIISCAENNDAWLLSVGPGNDNAVIEAARRTKGSSVRTFNLFDTIPARKRFLKREGSEGALCRQVFIEKALAFPEISFRFIQDGKLRMFLPSVTSYKERFSDAILASSGEAAFLHQISALSSGFNVTIVIGGPEVYRNHRKDQFVFANGRRIVDFGFNQALEYGTQGAFPNSSHPIGALFIDIDPHLADFNIHPAKKEAKFLCSGEIHHTVTEALRSYFRDILIKNGGSAEVLDQKMLDETPYDDVASWVASRAAAESAALLSKEKDDYSASGKEISYASEFFNNDLQSDKAVHYAGRAFGLFILVEKDDILYAIDQHAAHERLIYERMVSNPIPYQELLVPIPFTTDSAEDDYFLGTEQERLKKLGVIIVKDNNGWRIDALPVLWTLGDKDTVIKILSLRTAGENMADHWAATIACHSAIRDGEYMDDASALSLAKEALALPVRACPHGRPILIEIKKDELFKAVRRI